MTWADPSADEGWTVEGRLFWVASAKPNQKKATVKSVKERIGPLLDRIRKIRPDTPVLLVEGAPKDNARWVAGARNASKAEWAVLRSKFDERKDMKAWPNS